MLYKSPISLMNNIAHFYDEICSPCSENRIEFFSDLLVKSRMGKASVLDMSCSTGETCCELSKLGYNCTGIDLSGNMVMRSINKGKEFGTSQNFSVDDMRDVKTLNTQFDLIINNSLIWLSSLSDVSRTIKEVIKLLKNDGLFVIDIPRSENFRKTYKPLYCQLKKTTDKVIYKVVRYDTYPNRDTQELKTCQTYIVQDQNTGEEIISSAKFVLRLHSLEELTNILKSNELEIVNVVGDYHKSDIQKCGYYQIIIKRAK